MSEDRSIPYPPIPPQPQTPVGYAVTIPTPPPSPQGTIPSAARSNLFFDANGRPIVEIQSDDVRRKNYNNLVAMMRQSRQDYGTFVKDKINKLYWLLFLHSSDRYANLVNPQDIKDILEKQEVETRLTNSTYVSTLGTMLIMDMMVFSQRKIYALTKGGILIGALQKYFLLPSVVSLFALGVYKAFTEDTYSKVIMKYNFDDLGYQRIFDEEVQGIGSGTRIV